MMFSAAHQQVLDAVRAGDLDTLEQTPDEAFCTAAQCIDLPLAAVRNRHYHVAHWLLQKAEQLGDVGLVKHWRLVHLLAAENNVDALRHDVDASELQRGTRLAYTPLHVAALCDRVDVIKFLVGERGVDANVCALGRVGSLHVAADAGQVAAIEALVELEANVEARNSNWETPLLGAVQNHHVGAVQCLLRLGAKHDARDRDGNTALHTAVASANVELVDVFRKALGVDVNARGAGGRTPLHVATSRAGVAMVRLLIDMGADVDATCESGRTPLHYTCEEQADEAHGVVRVLLAAGADRHAPDAGRQSPRDVAMAQAEVDHTVVALLDSYFPIELPMMQLLLGLRGPTESPLTRFSAHALFEPRVLSLIKCLLTGEDKGAFSQLLEDVERG